MIPRFLEELSDDTKFVEMSVCYKYILALTNKGLIVHWGKFLIDSYNTKQNRERHKRAGLQPEGRVEKAGIYKSIPLITSETNEIFFNGIRSGPSHACGISVKGQMYAWGFDSGGRCGIPLTENKLDSSKFHLIKDPTLAQSLDDYLS